MMIQIDQKIVAPNEISISAVECDREMLERGKTIPFHYLNRGRNEKMGHGVAALKRARFDLSQLRTWFKCDRLELT
jgi:hypothetical protein